MQPTDDTAAVTGELVGQIQDNARKLGLTWQIVKATVAAVTSSAEATVTLDGDTVPVGAISMIGVVGVGQRVWVMVVPPGGNYVVGGIAPSAQLYVASTSNSSAIGVTPTSVLSAGAYTFKAGRAYSLSIGGTGVTSATTNVGHFDIRGDAAVLVELGSIGPTTVVGQRDGTYFTQMVRVTGSADVTYAAVDVFIFASAGTTTWAADEGQRYLWIKDVGAAAEFPTAVVLV